MAMSMAVAGAAHAGCAIDNPGCVAISYPTFFDVMQEVAKEEA